MKDGNWLCERYILDGLTCKQIASICGCHERTVHQRLISFGIPRRKAGATHRSEEGKADASQKMKRWQRFNMNQMKVARHLARCKGDKHWNWRGGITTPNESERRHTQYKGWRIAIFERDEYTCQVCGEFGCYLNAHHIKSFAEYPRLRLDLDNGIALCGDCHETITKKSQIGHPFRGNENVTSEEAKTNQ